MTQRNPMNDRYNDEKRTGKTRKSAASAKPSAERASTVRDPAPKSKKQKKQEAREREQRRQQQLTVMTPGNQRVEDQPEYKRLRRWWWVCLVGAMLLIALSIFTSRDANLSAFYIPCLILGYVLVIIAFYIDFGKIRKLRRAHEQEVLQGKSKEARAAQKKARAEAREQRKEAEEKYAAAKEAEEEKRQNSLFGRIAGKFTGAKGADAASEEAGDNAAQADAGSKKE